MCNRCRWGFGKVFGAALIVIGVIILFASLPYWMWLAVIGAALIIMGVVILRANC